MTHDPVVMGELAIIVELAVLILMKWRTGK